MNRPNWNLPNKAGNFISSNRYPIAWDVVIKTNKEKIMLPGKALCPNRINAKNQLEINVIRNKHILFIVSLLITNNKTACTL